MDATQHGREHHPGPRSGRPCGTPGVPRYPAGGYDNRDCPSDLVPGHERHKNNVVSDVVRDVEASG